MIKYHCEKCGIDCETSECPICKEKEIKKAYKQKKSIECKNYRTESESKIYWCENCNIPIYEEQCSICGQKGKYITTDLRPVFPEERLLLEILIGQPFKYRNCSVWNGIGNRYVVDGRKIKVSIAKLIKKNKDNIDNIIQQIKKYKLENSYEYFDKNIVIFIKANKKRFNAMVSEATTYIKKISRNYRDNEMFVSFSGGKDSTVTSDLVMKALSKPEVIHIFGNTTLEFPLTLEYITKFKKNNNHTPVITAKNKDKDFLDMCNIIGPPSRVMSWCCYVFKTSAINRKTLGVFKGTNKLLTFYGIRRSESSSRSKYDRESESPKITKQKVVSPIIDWYDFDIWLYLLTNKIDFNYAYRLGYARVGCWCCPNNSDWSVFLASIYMSEKYKEWRKFLIDFAKKIGKPDPEVYVDEGKWKARQGGNGMELSKNTFLSYKPCAVEDNSFNYEINRPITEQLYELFKPFGFISKDMGNERLGEVFIIDRNNNPLIRLQGRIGSNLLKISIIKIPLCGAKNIKDAKLKIECQLTKYQMCIGCLACEGVCKYNAIKIIKASRSKGDKEVAVNNEKESVKAKIEETIYKIDDDKCVKCGKCVNHFTAGCYMRKVLITRRGE